MPSITHFSASPEVIHPGGQLTLTWAVTGDETTVTITPEVGSVASSGSRQVQAETTTTYTLTAENSAGVVTADAVATVNLPPSAMFTQSETEGLVPLTVTFDATNSFDSDGVISTYFWRFSDGGVAEGQIVDYVFEKSGDYSVTLEVIDDIGFSASDTSFVEVFDEVRLRAYASCFEFGTAYVYTSNGVRVALLTAENPSWESEGRTQPPAFFEVRVEPVRNPGGYLCRQVSASIMINGTTVAQQFAYDGNSARARYSYDPTY